MLDMVINELFNSEYHASKFYPLATSQLIAVRHFASLLVLDYKPKAIQINIFLFLLAIAIFRCIRLLGGSVWRRFRFVLRWSDNIILSAIICKMGAVAAQIILILSTVLPLVIHGPQYHPGVLNVISIASLWGATGYLCHLDSCVNNLRQLSDWVDDVRLIKDREEAIELVDVKDGLVQLFLLSVGKLEGVSRVVCSELFHLAFVVAIVTCRARV